MIFRIPVTLSQAAHSRHPLGYLDAAVRPTRPDFGCGSEVEHSANSKCADLCDHSFFALCGRGIALALAASCLRLCSGFLDSSRSKLPDQNCTMSHPGWTKKTQWQKSIGREKSSGSSARRISDYSSHHCTFRLSLCGLLARISEISVRRLSRLLSCHSCSWIFPEFQMRGSVRLARTFSGMVVGIFSQSGSI